MTVTALEYNNSFPLSYLLVSNNNFMPRLIPKVLVHAYKLLLHKNIPGRTCLFLTKIRAVRGTV